MVCDADCTCGHELFDHSLCLNTCDKCYCKQFVCVECGKAYEASK